MLLESTLSFLRKQRILGALLDSARGALGYSEVYWAAARHSRAEFAWRRLQLVNVSTALVVIVECWLKC